jgi:hypothetical protein
MTDLITTHKDQHQEDGRFRYVYQRDCAERFTGRVLNMGCNEDPGKLRASFGERIINCDIEGWDKYMNRPNVVDRIFNCLHFPWPFPDKYADLVILGEILEHFPVSQMIEALNESKRVSDNVCITIPEDTRITEEDELKKWNKEGYNLHTTVATRDTVDHILSETGFIPTEIIKGEWGFDNIKGFCILAHAAS